MKINYFRNEECSSILILTLLYMYCATNFFSRSFSATVWNVTYELVNTPPTYIMPRASIRRESDCPHHPSIFFPAGLVQSLYEQGYSRLSSGPELIPCESGQWHEITLSIGQEEQVYANACCIVQTVEKACVVFPDFHLVIHFLQVKNKEQRIPGN